MLSFCAQYWYNRLRNIAVSIKYKECVTLNRLQNQLHKQTFLQGAIILILANATVKIIGAIFKIPLTYLIGPNGMGIYSSAYEIWKWLFIIATAGFPVAVSKMVSESMARENREEAHKIFRVAFCLLIVVGIAGTTTLFFGAGTFANLIGNSQARLAVIAMSPSLFFVALMSAYRGYFQGLQNMIPTAVSEVVEALGKLIIGFLLAYILIDKGVEYAAAGAILGVTSGTFLGAVGLYLIYQFSKKHVYGEIQAAIKQKIKVRSAKKILAELVRVAIPITIGASVFSLTSLIDAMMIMNRLQSIGYSEEKASMLFGYLQGYAVPLFNLPPTLIVALSISIVPAIANALAGNNLLKAKATTESALRLTVLFSLPAGMGLFLLAGPIVELIYRDVGAEIILQILGVAVLFVSLVLVSNAMLQASGKVMIPVRNMIIGGFCKVVINYFAVGIPEVNINGAPIGTTFCYLIITVLNLIEVRKVTKAEYHLVDFIIKPMIAVASMGVAVSFTYSRLMLYRQSNTQATLGAIFIGATIYGLMLLAIGAIKKEDILMMPKGKAILKVLNKFGLMK